MQTNKKLKILVCPSDKTGVGAFRSIAPHVKLEELYPNEFEATIDYHPQLDNDNYLKQYDIIHYHRTLGSYDNMENLLGRLKSLGIVSIMDIDDSWSVGHEHPAYLLIKNSGLDKMILNNIKIAENVTTTTEIYANEIRKHNKNKSVFVLPNAIDISEKQYQSNPEKSDRVRIGFLGGSCYDDTTEVLTENGFKLFKDLDKNEKVATLNPKTNQIEYNQPKNYIAEPFNGELNCAKTKLVEYAVTPNHKMYVSKTKRLRDKNPLSYDLIPSENIQNEYFRVKRNANWIGKEEEYFVLPKLEFVSHNEEELVLETINNEDFLIPVRTPIKAKQHKYLNEKYGEDKNILMDDWLKFFGFWMAEGWTSKSGNLKQVGVAQSKDNGLLEEMFNLLVKMGYNPTYTKDKKQVRVFDKQLWEYLVEFGNSYEKFVPKNILELSPRQLNIFLDYFIMGDGHIEKNQYTRRRVWTSSKQLADNLQEIALKTGIAATVTNRGKKTTQIKGRDIINQHDSYQIGFSKENSGYDNYLITPEKQFTKKYNGFVYCVEVKNHILYIRKNGKSFWCGNSHLHDLQILSGLFKNIKSDGLLDKVQFVLCGYDLRGMITMINEQTKEQTQRPITPKESVWYQYERIFTNDYENVSPEYKEFLLKFKEEEYPNVANEPYRRVWTKPISSYASNYNLLDVSLAPLVENEFNFRKSQLKVVEAGFHKKALIAQDFGPYKIDVKSAFQYGGGFDETANGILIETVKNHKDWYKAIKKLILNPELIPILGNNLYNTVKDTYSIEAVCATRRDLYKKLVSEIKEPISEEIIK